MTRIASAAFVALGVAIATPSVATTIDFEGAASGSDAATIGTPGASLSGGLVLSETFVVALLGYPATGTWNTTPGGANGANGAMNTLGAEIAIDFDLAVTALSVDVLSLPDAAGDPGSVLLLAFAGANLVASDRSDPLAIGDSGLRHIPFPPVATTCSVRGWLTLNTRGRCPNSTVGSRPRRRVGST